jgi:hypothetical protein
MPVAAAIGTTMPRFGIFISQNGVRVTRYSGRVDWSRQASRTSSNEVEVVVFSRTTLLVPSATPLGLQRPAAAAGSGRCRWAYSTASCWVSGSDRVYALAQRTYLILFWVGFLALSRGFSQIMLAFSIRHAGEEAAAIDPARPR